MSLEPLQQFSRRDDQGVLLTETASPSPGCLYYLSCWYTRKELGFRTAVLYSGALISGAFSGLISAGTCATSTPFSFWLAIGRTKGSETNFSSIAGVTYGMDGAKGLRAWRWLFIIEGAATIVIACGAFFVLPNFPRTTKWLTEEERALAVWRLEEDIGEDDWVSSEDQTFWQGAIMAFTDTKTYILVRIFSSPLSPYSLSLYPVACI